MKPPLSSPNGYTRITVAGRHPSKRMDRDGTIHRPHQRAGPLVWSWSIHSLYLLDRKEEP
jgi:hypothetical protein